MDLIPAIDIINGHCVRLTKGDYATKTTYYDDPVEVALLFESMGVKRLHMVDLDGAKANHCVNLKVLRNVREATSLVVDFGGGIKEETDLKAAFDNGADMVTLGSVAATQPEIVLEWVKTYGAQHFIVGADALEGRVRIKGWKEDSGQSLEEFVNFYHSHGVKQVLCTDISCDGMLQGPNVELYRSLMNRYPDLYLIASGGVSSTADLDELECAEIPAVVFGKAFYEGRIDLKSYMAARLLHEVIDDSGI